jgi:hypothetical protein
MGAAGYGASCGASPGASLTQSRARPRSGTCERGRRRRAQMTGGGSSVVVGPSDPETWHPDLDWLAAELQGAAPPKLVYVVSPGNPTGAATA